MEYHAHVVAYMYFHVAAVVVVVLVLFLYIFFDVYTLLEPMETHQKSKHVYGFETI